MRDIIGHGRIVDRLAQRAVDGGLAHAYELSGPRSVGKRTVALRVAQTLCCASAAAGGCGTCRACRLVDSGGHPDVTLVTRLDDRRDISIDQVRAMQDALVLRPLEGRRRVVIVDDAADLGEQAEVALLKTLEEPPPHALLLLITPTPVRLLDTIRSRLQALAFRPVPTEEIATGLRARFGDAAAAHAGSADGRPGLAILLATEDAVRVERRRLESELYRLIGSGLTDRFAWAAALADESDPRRRAEEIERRLVAWADLVRDAAVVAHGVERLTRPDRATESRALAGSVAAGELVSTALLIEDLRRGLEFSANARGLLELFALRAPYSAALAEAK